jgi:transposase InsO family protein
MPIGLALGIEVARVMTGNGSCYRSALCATTCRKLGIKHIRTKPYAPQTNGKAERFIQTTLREWAYATAFEISDRRRDELPDGSIATTTIGLMPASQVKHPSADSTRPETTS